MLLDTSGLLCYHHRDEYQHSNAVTFFQTATAHGKAKRLIYRSPVTGDVTIFDHDPF